MRNDLSDDDVLTFVLSGCNAAEIAAYSGTAEPTAQIRMLRVMAQYAAPARSPEPRGTLHLGSAA